MNEMNSISYIGPNPKLEYFEGIPLDVYNSLPQHYNLENELIKYLRIDCESLYLILAQFFKNIFKDFRLDVLRYPTISSIAMAVYRTCFL